MRKSNTPESAQRYESYGTAMFVFISQTRTFAILDGLLVMFVVL